MTYSQAKLGSSDGCSGFEVVITLVVGKERGNRGGALREHRACWRL